MRSVFTNFRASFSVWPKFGLWPLFQSILVQKSQAWGLPGHTVGSFALRTENDCFWGWKFFFHFPGFVLPGEFFFVITILGPNVKLDSEPKIFLRLAHFWDDLAKNDQIMVFTVLAKNQCAPHCPCLLNVFLGGNYLNWRHIQDLDVRFWVEAIYSNFCVLAPF